MIKTLRITSVVAAILAGVFFVFPVIYGVRNDDSVDKILSLPGVKEKFEKDIADTKTKSGQSPESPLVKQAEAFALYLNPVKTMAQKPPVKGGKIPTISRNVTVTPKFTILATIVYPENPMLSQALIDEPGSGRHWVRQSTMVGHLFIEQVKDGTVVLKSGNEITNLEITKKAETGPAAKPSPAAPHVRSTKSPTKPKATAFSRAASNVTRTRSVPKRAPISSRNEEKMDELVDKLKDLQKNPASDKTDSKIDPKERNARIQELISKYKSIRVSAEESEKLDNMGEEMNGIQEDPNVSLPEVGEDEADVNEVDEAMEDINQPESDEKAEK